jgi:hypothetical protein
MSSDDYLVAFEPTKDITAYELALFIRLKYRGPARMSKELWNLLEDAGLIKYFHRVEE